MLQASGGYALQDAHPGHRNILLSHRRKEGQERVCEKYEADPGTIPAGKYRTLLILNFYEIRYAPIDLLICHVLDDVQVPPWWLAEDTQCWEMIVDKWCAKG